MKEIGDLVRAWRSLPRGQVAILATVVGTGGSTYRKAGARMLLSEAAWLAGSVSGGCLEGDVIQTALSRTEEGPVLVTYDATADDDILWGYGLGCNGLVQVLVERLPPEGGPIAFLAECVEGRKQGAIATVVTPGPRLGMRWYGRAGGQGLKFATPDDPLPEKLLEMASGVIEQGRAEVVRVAELDIFVEPVKAPVPILIFGGGHDAQPLAEVAKGLGWHVTVVDHRSAYLTQERFPTADELVLATPREVGESRGIEGGAVAVIMNHSYLTDIALLRMLLPSPAAYVGLLGPRRRTDRMLSELNEEREIPEDQLKKLHAPIGLNLGAEGPDEVALAIAAEIQAFLNGRDAGFLRDRPGPLHEDNGLIVRAAATEGMACDLSA